MLVIRHTVDFRIELPTIVTIGTFDGVHVGHQKILNRLRELKAKTGLKTVVLTFEPHPRKILFPEQQDLKLISLVDEKLNLLKGYGVDYTVVYPFTEAFSQSSAAYYIEHVLLKQLNVRHLVIGHDHRFGMNRSGNIKSLLDYSAKEKFEVEQISAKDIDNIAISSSKIRKALEDGNIERANEFLGHPFSIMAEVIKGKQLGRQLGYPTANLFIDDKDKLVPKIGVYFVEVSVSEKQYFGMMSIGTNPTTDSDNTLKLEVHLFDFEDDIYGKFITVNFVKRLRDELKFDSITALKHQIERDEEHCLNLIALK